ncbi:MAG: hypothetical protein GY773_22330, partial [Actinomycetia bacterium]|nr:hypothetical protein [Actinomycetes bacterium]
MRIAVLLKQVPDLVEEFEVDDDGTDIDRGFMTFLLNEFDNQALEEALLIKDATGAEVDVVALDDEEIARSRQTDDVFAFTGIAVGVAEPFSETIYYEPTLTRPRPSGDDIHWYTLSSLKASAQEN